MYDNYGTVEWNQVSNKFLIDDETAFYMGSLNNSTKIAEGKEYSIFWKVRL